jgi:hypothetical protein
MSDSEKENNTARNIGIAIVIVIVLLIVAAFFHSSQVYGTYKYGSITVTGMFKEEGSLEIIYDPVTGQRTLEYDGSVYTLGNYGPSGFAIHGEAGPVGLLSMNIITGSLSMIFDTSPIAEIELRKVVAVAQP